MVFKDGLVFVLSIIVAGNGSRPDVDLTAYQGIAYVTEMRDLATRSDSGLLDLHKIAYFDLGL